MRLSLGFLALAVGAHAQSSAYTDANTGISFEGYEDTTGFLFGMALPSTLGSDFIGQMVGLQHILFRKSSSQVIL
jgi:cellobiose dehydrogenase (acceptor)